MAAIEDNGDRPDAGIWELSEKRWTHSRLICAAGLRAAAASGAGRDPGRLSTLADAIVAETTSAVCIPTVGGSARPTTNASTRHCCCLRCGGPCQAATHGRLRPIVPSSVNSRLDHYVYRYRPERGLGSTDSAFLLCGFVMAMAAQQQGQTIEAYRYFERNGRMRNPGTVLRRVRHPTAAVARQSAAGLRARRDVRGVEHAGRSREHREEE